MAVVSARVLLGDQKHSVRCRMSTAITKNADQTADWREQTEEMSMRERYLYMLEHDILTDCSFFVGPKDGETREFRAHRFLLSNVSPVFEAMLMRCEMVKVKTRHVRVTDLSPDTFNRMLRFIYVDEKAVSTFEEARDLAFVAHKYLIKPLLASAVDDLCRLMTHENIWTALDIASLLSQSQLLQACVEVLRIDTSISLACESFTQISEEHLVLLLEQDELDVDDELVLINMTVHWARHEARRRYLLKGDASVRAVLAPRLLSLLRFLAVSPLQFMIGPAIAHWLTFQEKSALTEALKTGDTSRLPSYLSTAPKRNKAPPILKGRMSAKIKQVVRNRDVSQPRSYIVAKPLKIVSARGIAATLIFRVRSRCSLMGFECLSRFRAEDPTLVSKPLYEEKVFSTLRRFNHSLSTDFEPVTICRKDIRYLCIAYNSRIKVMFDEAVPLDPDHWYGVHVHLQVDSAETSPVPIKYENPARDLNVCTAGVQFLFHAEIIPGCRTSENDGLFRSLFFFL